MTIAESRYMECVPRRLNEISKSLESLALRFVKVNDTDYVNPTKVTGIFNDANGIHIACGKDIYKTNFATTDDAVSALTRE